MLTKNAKKITGMHLKFVCLVKLLSNPEASLSRENPENKGNFEDWDLTNYL